MGILRNLREEWSWSAVAVLLIVLAALLVMYGLAADDPNTKKKAADLFFQAIPLAIGALFGVAGGYYRGFAKGKGVA